MYEYLKGELVEVQPTYAVIDCGGVGHFVNITLNTYSAISSLKEVMLYVHFVVREDAHLLYGFAKREERAMFRQLISVSGIGPNTANLMLSQMTVNEIAGAIETGNVDAIKRVKGIGLKTAQRVIVELKDKADVSAVIALPVAGSPLKEEALSALVSLGFAKAVAQKALEKIDTTSDTTVEDLIKQLLKVL